LQSRFSFFPLFNRFLSDRRRAARRQSRSAEGPARTFSARDLFGLRVASDPQFRPDGGAIAYVRITYDIFTDQGQPSIWLVDPDTGVQSPLVVDESANFARAGLRLVRAL